MEPASASVPGQPVASRRGRVDTALLALPRAFQFTWMAHPGFTIALALLALISGLLPTGLAWLSKLLTDQVVAAITAPGDSAALDTVIILLVIQFALLLGNSLVQTLSNISQQLLQERTGNLIQQRLMEQANRLDLSFFENPEFYDSLRQAQREADYRPVRLVQQLFTLVRSVIVFVGMITLVARLGWGLALLTLLVPIPGFIADSRYGWQGYMLARQQSADRRRMSYYLDLLTRDTYNKEIQLFGLGPLFLRRWRAIADRFYEENSRLVQRRYLLGFAWGSLTTLAQSGALAWITFLTIARYLTLGDLVLYTQAISSVRSSFGNILSSFADLYESGLYLTNLLEFLKYTPTLTTTPDAPVPVVPFQEGIEFRAVTFTYPGRTTPTLHKVSFVIHPHETVALVGLNGAGKTTIVKLLARLYDPDAGQILLNGRDLREYDLTGLRAAIGVLFQDYTPYFLTARENIGLGCVAEQDNAARIESAARKSGADAVIAHLPQGYDTTLGRWFNEGFQISGGEWQKIALARTLMRDAPRLVLDEPTASLDARAEQAIFAHMRALTRGKMALFISHRLSTARLADRILVLEQGTISQVGTHEELLAAGGAYALLFNLQASTYR